MKIFGIPEDYCKCFLILFLIAYFMMNSDLSLNIIEGNKNKEKNKGNKGNKGKKEYKISCKDGSKPSILPFKPASTGSEPAPTPIKKKNIPIKK